MSEFETYIQDWQNAIAENEELTPEDITELEDHLQTDFLQLKEMGLNDQDAFWLAEKHLGRTDALTREYGKVNGSASWARRTQWMLIGILVFWLLQSVVSFVSQLSAAAAAFSGSGWISFIVYGLVQVAILIGLLYEIYHLIFGTGKHSKVLGSILQFVRATPGKALVIIILSTCLLSLGTAFFVPYFMSNLLGPNQFSSFAYGMSGLSFVMGIVYPLLIISLLIQSLRKRRPLQQIIA